MKTEVWHHVTLKLKTEARSSDTEFIVHHSKVWSCSSLTLTMSYYCLVDKQGKLIHSHSVEEKSDTKHRPPIITCKKSWSSFDLSPSKVNHTLSSSKDRLHSGSDLKVHKYVSIYRKLILKTIHVLKKSTFKSVQSFPQHNLFVVILHFTEVCSTWVLC